MRYPPVMASFTVGDRVHYPAQGLGTIEREAEHEGVRIFYLQMDSGNGIGVPIADAATMMWPLPSRERAERLLARLLIPAPADERPWPERYESFEQVMLNGTLEECVEVLRGTLARRTQPSFGEQRIRLLLEDNVIAPIAERLGEDPRALFERVEQAQRSGER